MTSGTKKRDSYRVLRPAGDQDKYWFIHTRRNVPPPSPEVRAPRSSPGRPSGNWQL